MAHLVRVQQVRYVDRDGHRVSKGAKGARKVKEKSAKWYGCGIPGQGKKRVPLATDKEAAQRLLNERVKAAERGEAKMLDRAATARPLSDHLADYETELALGIRVSTGRKRRTAPSAKQVQQVVQRVRDVLDGCGFKWADDLKAPSAADRLSRYLRGRIGKPRNPTDRGIGAQTATFLLAEAVRFVRWLARKGTGVPGGAFDSVASFDPANARMHARREVTPEELGKVLDAARSSPKAYRKTMIGADRYTVYLTAFVTGYRAGELASLTPDHFRLDADPPTVALPGHSAKNKKTTRQPIPQAVADVLRPYLTGRAAQEPIWPGKWKESPALMLRRDLATAGVPYRVETPAGAEYADFHALRHTFVSTLAATGAGTKELQTLARHSDPRLTLGVYSHARPQALAAAVNRLQIPGAAPAAGPFAHLTRDALERLALGLCVMLGTLLAPPGDFTGQSSVALRVAPDAGISGDSGGQVDTKRVKRRRV